MLRAPIAQIVTVHTRDDDEGELERRDDLGEIGRLLRVEGQRAAMPDVTERTTARADVAHDHERRRAFAEAFADVRAGGLFAHGVQSVLAKDLLDLVEARTRGRTHANPFRLPERRG